MKAEDIIKSIEGMDNGERIKTLELLFDTYFDNRPPKEVIEAFREWYEEVYHEQVQKG